MKTKKSREVIFKSKSQFDVLEFMRKNESSLVLETDSFYLSLDKVNGFWVLSKIYK